MRSISIPIAILTATALLAPARSQEPVTNVPEAPSPTYNPVFEVWDTDGDGYITAPEYVARVGGSFEAALAIVDQDGDGRISRAEHDRLMADDRRERGAKWVEQAAPEGTRIARDITYTNLRPRKLLLDAYLPPGENPAWPAVIWLHGGGWDSGAKEFLGPAVHLIGHGYAVISIEYRLASEATFPAPIEDCKAAVSFVRANARRLGIDPDRIGVFGESAGGHLAALLGVTNGSDRFRRHPVCRRASSDVAAVCAWYAPSDLMAMSEVDKGQAPEAVLLGRPAREVEDLARLASPITHVGPHAPPFLLMHGDSDDKIAPRHSEVLHAALEQADVDVELVRVPGAGHGFKGAQQSVAELMQRVAAFFDRTLAAR